MVTLASVTTLTCIAEKSIEGKMNDGLTLGSRIVFKMTDKVQDPFSHSISFDKYFTISDLLAHPVKKSFEATRTLGENRLKMFFARVWKHEAGSLGNVWLRFDDKTEVIILKWVNNKCVMIGINNDKIEPTCNVLRLVMVLSRKAESICREQA